MVDGSKIAMYPASGTASLLAVKSVLVRVCASKATVPWDGTVTARVSEDTWGAGTDARGASTGTEVEEEGEEREEE